MTTKVFDLYREAVGQSQISRNHYKVRMKNASDLTEVYVVPFSHVDPGWLKTFDNYLNETNAILDNMILFLVNHPKMRFIWCEIAFFERWWSVQDEITKSLARTLIANKQLEIVSGSWVMTDEGTTYFPSTVDNIIEGQQFANSELNVQSEVMWSIDPFGYSSTVPYLFTKTDTYGESEMLTQVLPYSHYDILNSCGPDPRICCQYDFKRLNHFSCPDVTPVTITSLNVRLRALELEKSFLNMALEQGTNTLLSVWGDDFRYSKLEEWYQQYDNLILLFDYINKYSKSTKIRFGTLSEYFNALEQKNKARNLSPATLSGDFFPYQGALSDYWTGYYTTRPFYKRQERELHSFIRAADLLSTNVFANLSTENRQLILEKLTVARRNLALFQHHDAITGTSKNHVMKDYSERMFESLKIAEDVTILVYNSEPYERMETIELLVSDPNLIVIGMDGPIRFQIEPYFDAAIDLSVINGMERLMCEQTFGYYENTSSGAYIMKLEQPQPTELEMDDAETFIVSGSLRQTVYTLTNLVKQRAEESRLHLQLYIDIREMLNAELLTTFVTDMISDDVQYYTDSNGLQLIRRAEYKAFNQPEMNYYPMPTALVLQDGRQRLSVLSNIPHGVRTFEKTNFEIVLDRRLSFDDGKGLGYADDGLPVDNLPVNMEFTFVLESIDAEKQQQRRFAFNTLAAHLALQSLIYQPIIFIIPEILKQPPVQHFSSFPCDVQLLTIRPVKSDITRRLMILHRAGIDCTSLNFPICPGTEFDEAVKGYLQSIGVSTVQKTLLNGVQQLGNEIPYGSEKFLLEPTEFATYLLRFG
uniref:mannosyl-oligosaccharide 1,3-1,6-alpha-mannosidase n=1 Tax=Setaria digitata TaxID=48799 RepID=A0A915PTA9_9BILA